MVNTPRLEPEKVRIEKELMMEGLRRLEDDPQEYAFREFRKRLYRDNPRGNQSSITSVSGITPDDLAAFHRQYFYPANMMLTVTGDINREEAVKLIMQYFPKSPSHETPPTLPAPVLQGDGRVNLVQKVTPQSIVLLGFPAPAKQSPDFYAFSILDFILGSGGFQSRIFHEIRNNLGLAYSAGSFYKARADYGVFSAYAMTKSETTVQVLEAIKAIIRSVGAEPLTPEEIRWAKKAIINNFLFSFVSAEQIAMQQLMIEYDHLAPDFLKHYRERIQRVKPTDIQRLTGQDLLPNRAIILILGDENRFDRPTDVKQPSGTGL
jgi:predicted Zn-dependent peptidase